MLALYVEAPFAVCRTFTAGWYRPTATFLTPSAAYGLVLNLAGIESRLREEDDQHPGKVGATLIRRDLPSVKLAVGASTIQLRGSQMQSVPEGNRFPRMTTVYQQLHNYPVGTSGGDRAANTFGNKYNIAPVRRELLVDIRAIVALDGDADLEKRIQHGLAGQLAVTRYGLPFLGDNAFLLDRVESLNVLPQTHWYERVTEEQAVARSRTTRMTTWIDRADLSRTKSDLFAPSIVATTEVPSSAWTPIPPS